MDLQHIDHVTIRGRPQDVDGMRDFYRNVLGLRPGPRPDFAFPGYWMYLGDTPVVHIAGSLPADGPAAPAGGPGSTGRFDHLSFRTKGLAAVRTKLEDQGITFQGTKVPGFDLYQLFFYDPAGVKVELTFDGAEAR
ncbi:MAG TPA: VOC family protein [Acetobacteraceae bacterium]|nr:VOC family protein [Acetobacteraceae bacterium]